MGLGMTNGPMTFMTMNGFRSLAITMLNFPRQLKAVLGGRCKRLMKGSEERMTNLKYAARIIEERKGFSIEFIDFPNAVTQGDTIDELLKNGRDVLSIALKHLIDRGREMPIPSDACGDNIAWIEPSAKIRRMLGHRPGCSCPACKYRRTPAKERDNRIGLGFVRLPKSLVQSLRSEAERRGRTMTDLVKSAVEHELGFQ